MKARIIEGEMFFEVELTAETLAEAAALVRFGLNRTEEIRSCVVTVGREGSFESGIVFAKRKNPSCYVQKTK